MSRSFYGLMLALMFAVWTIGCAPSDTTESTDEVPAVETGEETAEAHPEHHTLLCGKCGHEKGTESCCAEGAETCEKCGLHAGSKLCCAELSEDAAGKDICSGCGHVAEGHHHCDENCEKCESCGMHAGSPACCKLKAE